MAGTVCGWHNKVDGLFCYEETHRNPKQRLGC
jgi:hypothetical protein